MAKETEQLKKDLQQPQRPAAASGPSGPTGPSSASGTPEPLAQPKTDMELMKERIEVLEAQLGKALQMIPASTASPEIKADGPVVELIDKTDPAPGTERRKYRVFLKHCKPAIVSADVVPGTAHLIRDQVIAKYNGFFNIVKSEHAYEVLDVTDL